MRTDFTWWIAIILFFSLAAWSSAGEAPTFQTLDQYTRTQLPVTTGTAFRLLNSNPGEAKLIVDRMRPEQLTALQTWKDKRVKSIQVNPTGLDKAEITVRFQQAGTDSFAYTQG